MSDLNVHLFKSLRMYCQASAIVVFALACLVLYGWTVQIAPLMSVFPGRVTTKANTAVALASAAMSPWLLLPTKSRRLRLLVGRLLAPL